ncbi:hypothetical protein ACP275_10G058300 [Erythranthe tilingii]
MASLSFTRRFSQSPVQQALGRHFQKLHKYVSASTVALDTTFSGPDNRDADSPCRLRRTGVFLDSTTILTSANAVGRVAAEKPDGSDRRRHRSEIATTVAVTRKRTPLKTKPLAVSFAHDVAVLKVVDPPPEKMTSSSFRPCSIAKSPPKKDDILMAIIQREVAEIVIPGNVRAAMGERATSKVKAPWPLQNDSGWMEFDFHTHGLGGSIGRESGYSFHINEITGTLMTLMSGGALFNIHGKLIGVGSWDVRDDCLPFPLFFAAPLSRIVAAVDYAKTRKPDDPIVMDTWIEG